MKEVFIERQDDMLRIAVRRDGKLKEYFVEEENNKVSCGQIYKGIVKNVVPAIKCAFIDIGKNKNCYMYLDRKFNNYKIKKGDELLVEIVKEAIGDKGPKVTNAISIPGRYSVLNTLNNEINISKKINDNDFIQKINNNVVKPKDIGITIRTNAQNVSINHINNEIEKLYEVYLKLLEKSKYSLKTGLIYSDKGIMDKILRDIVGTDKYKMVVNDKNDYFHTQKYIEANLDVEVDLKLHDKVVSIFDYYCIEKELLNLRHNKVTLNCGGYIIIEKTEAMYVIDVNSGKNTKSASIKNTALTTNLEAAKEIASQIRLRNLSGIILIDFIDMKDEDDKNQVIEKLKLGFANDKNKTVIYSFTELNLVQIARRRRGKSINDYMEEKCTFCKGSGKRLKYSYIKKLIRNEILRMDEERDIKDIYIQINKLYRKDISEDVISFVNEIGGLNRRIYVNYIDKMDYFKVEPIIFSSQIANIEMFKIYG